VRSPLTSKNGKTEGKKIRRSKKRIQRITLLAKFVEKQVGQVGDALLFVLEAQRHLAYLPFHTKIANK
jgi:hypothetical protein